MAVLRKLALLAAAVLLDRLRGPRKEPGERRPAAARRRAEDAQPDPRHDGPRAGRPRAPRAEPARLRRETEPRAGPRGGRLRFARPPDVHHPPPEGRALGGRNARHLPGRRLHAHGSARPEDARAHAPRALRRLREGRGRGRPHGAGRLQDGRLRAARRLQPAPALRGRVGGRRRGRASAQPEPARERPVPPRSVGGGPDADARAQHAVFRREARPRAGYLPRRPRDALRRSRRSRPASSTRCDSRSRRRRSWTRRRARLAHRASSRSTSSRIPILAGTTGCRSSPTAA